MKKGSIPFLAVMALVLSALAWPAMAGDNRWTNLGPYGGHVTKFAFHPRLDNVVFASGGSGLFLSNDSGRSWKRVADWGGSWGIAANVRIHSKDDSRVLASWGSHIYASTNLGTTWEQLSTTGLPEDIYDMEFDPSNPHVLYALTFTKGVFQSSDGGRTWVERNKGLDLPAVIQCCGEPHMEVDPADGDTVFVLLPTGKAYKTTNGGRSWKVLDHGAEIVGWTAQGLVIDKDNPDILYAAGGGISKTTSAGRDWWMVNNSGAQWDLDIDDAEPLTLYATSDGVVTKTTDGGSTWVDTRIDFGRTMSVAVHPRKDKTVFVGGWFQGVFRSTNAGKTWLTSNAGVDDMHVWRTACAAKPAGKLFAIATNAVLFESSNGGKTWTRSSLMSDPDMPFDLCDFQIHPANPGLMVVVSTFEKGAGIVVSTNGGKTWSKGTVIADTSAQAVIALDPRDQQAVFIAPVDSSNGAGLGVARSTDQGKTWQFINAGLSDKAVTTLATGGLKKSMVFAGTQNGRVFQSANGGADWKKSATVLNDRVTGILVNSRNSNDVYATTLSGIYKSTNGGTTWVLKSRAGCWCVAQYPSQSDTLLAGGLGSLWISTDGAETWSAFDSTGLPPVNLFSIAFDPTNPEKCDISSERGVFTYTRKGLAGGPVIEQLSPSAGKAGDAIAINGHGFGQLQGDSKVLFGNIDAGVAQSWSNTSAKVTVPAGVRTGSVTVTVFGKKSNPFEFIVLPATGSIEPTSGPAAGGTRVTILSPVEVAGGEFNVLFGSALATNIRFAQPNIITCDSPAGTPGTVDVKVVQTLTSTTVGTFTYR